MSPILCILPEPVLTLRAKKLPKQGPLFRGRAIILGAVLDHRHFGRQQLNRFWLPVNVGRSPNWVQEKGARRTLAQKIALPPVSHSDPGGDGLVLRVHWELLAKPLPFLSLGIIGACSCPQPGSSPVMLKISMISPSSALFILQKCT